MSNPQSFTSLTTWQKGHQFIIEVYRITTSFPKEELFSLTNQIRRSAVSITSNIAEGFNRQTYKDKLQFYYIALGSLTELQNQLLIARDVKYLDKKEFYILAEQSVEVAKLLNGLIRSTKKRGKQ